MLSRFVPVAAIVAAFLFGLQTTFQRVSADDASAVQPKCCVANADCCRVQQACCLIAVPKPPASELRGQNVAAQPTRSAIAKPNCCVKGAYCCQMRRPCCRSAASEVPNVPTGVEDPAINTTAVVAKPTCCAKHAYCCSQKQPCCR